SLNSAPQYLQMFLIRHESTAVRVLCAECGATSIATQMCSPTLVCGTWQVMIGDKMTNEIIKKLRKHLVGGVRTECRVGYLLAKIRKILEDEKPNPRPLALWMFCHWALHVNLSR